MGTRKQQERQEDIWIAHTELASAPAHSFYQRLKELLEAERFHEFVESDTRSSMPPRYGRPSMTPGIYFRSLLIGYSKASTPSEGSLGVWRTHWPCGVFVGVGLAEQTPDYSTISRKRRPIDVESIRKCSAGC
jgi:hypothetical protein